jgi:tetratricopeptide (TPR) repeat protein
MMSRLGLPARLSPALLALLLLAGACAPKTAPVTAPGAPKFPDFVYPAVADAASPAAQQHDAAWQALQAGDLRTAERGFQAVLKRAPEFFAAEAGLGYVALAKKDYKAALAAFDRGIAVNATYAPALAGRGQTYLAMNQPQQALASFDAALAADPTLTAIRSTADVLRFQGLQGGIAAARKATEAGNFAEARTAYLAAIAATPDSPFLYRELAVVERRDNHLDEALQYAQKALELEPSDPRNHVAVADVLEAQGRFAAAADALGGALALEANDSLTRRVDALREAAAREALPEEFKTIEQSATITRAQLAALIGVELDDLVKRAPARPGAVMSDIRGNWAQPWILSVTRAGFMDPLPNHAFQPNAVVRRGDLAQAVSQVLNVVAASRPKDAAAWRSARPKFADVPPGHLNYPAAAIAVAAGVLPLENGSFQLSRPVTGVEAIAAVKKLRELAGARRR